MSLIHPQSLRPPLNEPRRRPLAIPAVVTPPVVSAEPPDSALAELMRFFEHHYRLLLLAATAGMLLGFLYAANVQPGYRATATIEVQDVNENFLQLKDVASATPPASAANDLQTQLRILQSKSLIARVIRRVNPGLDPEAAARALQVRETRQSRIVDLTYESPDPSGAAAFVNELAQQYIDQNVESRLEISRGTSEWLERQLEQTRAKLADSERRLQSYAENSGLLVTNEAQRPDEEKLRQVQENLSKAQENRMVKEARKAMAATAPLDSLEAPLGGPLGDLRAKLADLRRQRAELVAVYTTGFPPVKRLDAQISDLEASVRKEASSVLQAINNDYTDAVRREKLLMGSYAQQVRQVTAKAGKAIQYGILKNEVNSNRDLYNNMLQRAAEAKVAAAMRASHARLVDRATPPRLPFKPNRFLSVLSGGTAGLLAGLVLVAARGRHTRPIANLGELAALLKTSELGAIPNDSSPPLQAYRAVLTSILLSSAAGPPPKVIAVVSAHSGEGKSQLVLNLAGVLSQMKQRVLMIDGSRDGRLQELFGHRCDYGLGDAARLSGSGRGLLPYVTDATKLDGVDMASLGPQDSSALDLVFSQGMEQLIEEMRGTYDIVLIDTPAILEHPDARVFARMADGAVLVVESGKATAESVQTAAQRLRWDDSILLGAVLNRA